MRYRPLPSPDKSHQTAPQKSPNMQTITKLHSKTLTAFAFQIVFTIYMEHQSSPESSNKGKKPPPQRAQKSCQDVITEECQTV